MKKDQKDPGSESYKKREKEQSDSATNLQSRKVCRDDEARDRSKVNHTTRAEDRCRRAVNVLKELKKQDEQGGLRKHQ